MSVSVVEQTCVCRCRYEYLFGVLSAAQVACKHNAILDVDPSHWSVIPREFISDSWLADTSISYRIDSFYINISTRSVLHTEISF